MTSGTRDTEKLRRLVKLLPGVHCGKCGYDNCGAYAVALVEGKAAPLTCRKSLDNIKEICGVLDVPVPENAAQLAEEHRRRHAGKHGHGILGPHGHHHGKGDHHGHHPHHG